MKVCKVCEQYADEGNYRIMEVIQDQGPRKVIICIWCAQLVKETFEK